MRLIDADELKRRFKTTIFRGNRFCEAFDAYVDAAPTIEPQKWIPCSERLPEILETVLVTCRKAVKHKTRKYNYSIKSAWHVYYPEINFTKWHFHNTSKNDAERLEVIAWMPMPKPYYKE